MEASGSGEIDCKVLPLPSTSSGGGGSSCDDDCKVLPSASVDGAAEGGVSDSVKVMADKHAIIRTHLHEAEMELANKSEAVKALEDKIRVGCAEICVGERTLRNLNETVYLDNETLQQLEKHNHELILESVDIEWKIIQTTRRMEALESEESLITSKMEEFKKRVLKAEMAKNKENEIIEVLHNEIDKLLEIKAGLERNDADLEKIRSGQTLQIVEAQKMAIMEAYSDQEAELQQLQQKLMEKEKEVQKIEQIIKIQEKQNQARLLKMQKQLQELEETESHLQSTVRYMESQIDFGTK